MKKLTGAAGGMMLVAMLPASGWAAGCDIDATRTQRVTLPDLLIDPNLPPGSVIGSKIVSGGRGRAALLRQHFLSVDDDRQLEPTERRVARCL